jgi:hypothetical protein
MEKPVSENKGVKEIREWDALPPRRSSSFSGERIR